MKAFGRYTILIGSFLSVACSKDAPNTVIANGVATKLPHLWETPIERPLLGGIGVNTPIIYDTDKVLIGSAVPVQKLNTWTN